MTRKFLVLLALAIAVGAVAAPTASAESIPVHAEGESSSGELEASGDNTIALQVQVSPGVWADYFRCGYHAGFTASEDGFFHVHGISLFATTGSSPNCTGADDCGAEWHGQAYEDETTGATRVHFEFCTNRTGAGEITCEIDAPAAEAHCNNSLVEGSPNARVTGEVSFNYTGTITDAE